MKSIKNPANIAALLGDYSNKMIAIWWDGIPVGDYCPLADLISNRDEQGLAEVLVRLEDQERKYIDGRIDILRRLTSTWPKDRKRQLLNLINMYQTHERFKYGKERAIQRACFDLLAYVQEMAGFKDAVSSISEHKPWCKEDVDRLWTEGMWERIEGKHRPMAQATMWD